MIVATAGHIDHGKTQLVRALTGVDTDRLPEEKARGISIDLGFAYWPLPQGGLVGFVDVPGHERFVRNMLAGVCGIDFALLVVAADDGVMPQTVEHLQILDLLGVRRGIAVLTKIDRVAPQRRLAAQGEVRAALAGSTLADAPVLPVSSLTGEGVAALREALLEAARHEAGRLEPGRHFRLAIDRAFTIVGTGTVVTGTVFDGVARPGDRLVASPAGIPVRVRGIQVRGREQARARAGERCAMALGGVEVASLARGAWILHEALHAPTQRIEARMRLLAGEPPLEHWTRVHLHLATMECVARVATLRGQPIAPGTEATVQLALDRPIAALHGDRCIVRDESARRTIGGGFVIDAFARARRRAAPDRLAVAEALARCAPEDALAQSLRIPDKAVDLDRFELNFNLDAERAGELYRAARACILGREPRVAIAGELAHGLRARIAARLAEFHRDDPRSPGLACDALHVDIAPWLDREAFASLLRAMADARELVVQAGLVSRPGFDATANAADVRIWEAVQPVLLEAGFAPPTTADLAERLGIPEATIRDFLHRKARSGEVLRVGEHRFYPRPTLAALAALATALARSLPEGFTAAQYRDATGTTRAITIPVLECLDLLGITQRTGDLRRIGRDYVAVLGEAPARRILPQPKTPTRPALARQATRKRRRADGP